MNNWKVLAIKTYVPCLVLVLCAASTASAQDRRTTPDFNGTWRLIESQNSSVSSNQTTNQTATTLIIVHQDPEIRMTLQTVVNRRASRLTHIYFTDNRGETNRAPGSANRTLSSRTRWRNGELEIRRSDAVTIRLAGDATRTVSIEANERWQLSSDGRTLVQIITTRLPRGFDARARNARPIRNVFSRVG
jgi:CCR4-NOT transcriptional regulation complex NOT5 subunit